MYRGFAPVSTIVRYNRGKGFAKRGQVLCRACKVCKVWGKGGGEVRSGLGGKGVTGRRREAAEGSRPLPTGQKIHGRYRQSRGPGMPGPYRLPQMGCRREGQGREAVVPGQSFHSAERCPINRTQKRPKNRLVRHCGQNAHNEFENLCNFLNKTPLRKRGFLVQ